MTMLPQPTRNSPHLGRRTNAFYERNFEDIFAMNLHYPGTRPMVKIGEFGYDSDVSNSDDEFDIVTAKHLESPHVFYESTPRTTMEAKDEGNKKLQEKRHRMASHTSKDTSSKDLRESVKHRNSTKKHDKENKEKATKPAKPMRKERQPKRRATKSTRYRGGSTIRSNLERDEAKGKRKHYPSRSIIEKQLSSEDEANFDWQVDFGVSDSGEDALSWTENFGARIGQRYVDDSGHEYSCLSPEEIILEQNKLISEISELLDLTSTQAACLIQYYQWNTEKLVTSYFESPEKVLKEVGLLTPCNDLENGPATLSGIGECLICCTDYEAKDCCALKCEHRFCGNCWKAYLSLKIQEGEVHLHCPAISCNKVVPEQIVKDIVDRDYYEKYSRFLTKSFVDDSRKITWCPSPGCNNAITLDDIQGAVVRCACGFQFCFSCHEADHRPATCEQMKQWQRKCSDESETSHWVGANTKGCPKCKLSVEKAGGCNHMSCRQCGYDWCWLCCRGWRGHYDFYSCDTYERTQRKKEEAAKESKKKKAKSRKLSSRDPKKVKKTVKSSKKQLLIQLEEERENQRAALAKYLEYHQKYEQYEESFKNGDETIREAIQCYEKSLSEMANVSETQFLEKARKALRDCYYALKNSCVCAYYLNDDCSVSEIEKQMFLFCQSELHSAILTLIQLVNDPSELSRRKLEIIDATNLAQNRMYSLVSAAETCF